jgi:inner membrane protein
MDTVTHGLTGWLIARALPERWKLERPRAATAMVILGSVLPDADNAARLLGSEAYVRIHRGLSHSLLGIAVSSLLLALLLARVGQWRDWKRIASLLLLGQCSHVALDLLNSYGTQILQPFSDARFALDLLFIVDLAFTGIIVAGIVSSRGSPFRARAALAVLIAYVGAAGILHLEAKDAVRDAALRYGVKVVSAEALPALGHIAIPAFGRLAFAPPAYAAGSREGAGSRAQAREIPFPAGPFSWNGFIDDGRTYLRARVQPLTGQVSWRQRVVRGADVPEVRALRGLEDVETYLWFARYPVARVASAGRRTVVTFSDLRFGGLLGRRPFLLRVTEAPGAPPRARWGR